MGRKSRLKRERQLEDLADRLEEGEFDTNPEAPWRVPGYSMRLYIRAVASMMGGILLFAIMRTLWSGGGRSVVTALEAVGLLFCGFQGWEAKKAKRHDVAKFWFVLGIAVVGVAELWHWKPEAFPGVFGEPSES